MTVHPKMLFVSTWLFIYGMAGLVLWLMVRPSSEELPVGAGFFGAILLFGALRLLCCSVRIRVDRLIYRNPFRSNSLASGELSEVRNVWVAIPFTRGGFENRLLVIDSRGRKHYLFASAGHSRGQIRKMIEAIVLVNPSVKITENQFREELYPQSYRTKRDARRGL